MGYTKLFGSIVHSTIWTEPNHIRLVWITMLALADRHHVVEASVPGLADAARVTLPECEDALERLQQPDKYSRSQEFEGRRIEPVDGGWLILNGEKYQAKMSADDIREKATIRKRRQRQRARERDVSQKNVTVTECPASHDTRLDKTIPNETPASAGNARASEPAATDGPLLSPQAAMAVPIQDRAKRVLAHEHSADYASPNEWPEVVAIAEAVHKSARWSPPKLGSYSRDSGVRAVVELLATGFTPPEVTRAMPRLVKSEWWQERRRTLASLTPNVVRRAVDDSGPVMDSTKASPSLRRALARAERWKAEMAKKEAAQCEE